MAEVADNIKKLGDDIANLTLKQAKELSDYIKEKYKIEPAAGGAVMVAQQGGPGPAAAAAEQTEFDVVMTAFGDKKLVEGVPAKIKEKVSKEDAAKVKAELEAVGAAVELK